MHTTSSTGSEENSITTSLAAALASFAALSSSLSPNDQEILLYLILSSSSSSSLHSSYLKHKKSSSLSKSLRSYTPFQRQLLESIAPSLKWDAKLKASSPSRQASLDSAQTFSCSNEKESLSRSLSQRPSFRGDSGEYREGKPGKKPASPQCHEPAFGCNCFQCYKSFWSRWDVSPNRDVIHKAIDLFEEHLAKQLNFQGSDTDPASKNDEKKMARRGKGRRREKTQMDTDGKRVSNKDRPGMGSGDASSSLTRVKLPSKGAERVQVGEKRAAKEQREEGGSGGARSGSNMEAVAHHKGVSRTKKVAPVEMVEGGGKDVSSIGGEKEEEAKRYRLTGGLLRSMFPEKMMGFVAQHMWSVWRSSPSSSAIALY